MSRLAKNVFNAVAFNVVWLICVFGGNAIAVAAAIILVSLHLKFISEKPREIFLLAGVVILGLFVDSGLIRSGLLVPPDQSVYPPLWLLSLWAIFATTLDHSTSWFQKNLWIAAAAGGIAGPLTYFTGTKLTNYSLSEPLMRTIPVLAIVWAVVFVVCMMSARLLNRPAKQCCCNDT